MSTPKISRPQFPPGYVENPTKTVPWEMVEQRLAEAKNYWLCSVYPDGRPHVIPRWAVYVDGKIYYDGSPETRHARNITQNPRVALHLESGDQALIVDGTAKEAGKPSKELAAKIAAAYCAKYTPFGYSPQPDQWNEGGLFVFTPKKVLTWTNFMDDPTRFVLTE
jgi:nitroimidazol reductase NimA-like FMN-containing flavoprotein (pyridoxamine 5'-phosphate oxidase superfamily)